MEPRASYGDLIPCGGGDPIPLRKTKLLVGRRKSCDVWLGFPNVSSHHCELELINGYWRLRDLNSRNGIKVNGVRCDQKWVLPGDEVSIAKHRYELVYHPSGDAPPPTDEDPFALGLLEKAGLSRRPERDPNGRGRSYSAYRGPANESAAQKEVNDWLADDDDLD